MRTGHSWWFVEKIDDPHHPDRWRCSRCDESILVAEGYAPDPEEMYWTGMGEDTPTCEESIALTVMEA